MLRLLLCLVPGAALAAAEDFPKPYGPPCTEREEVFAFAEKPAVRTVGADNYEITFESKGNCDVTVGIVDEKGKVVRHLGAGVLGANAPTPFQKNSLKQKLYWNGKDDLQAYSREPGRLRVRVEAELGSQTQVSVRTQVFGEGRWSGILPVKDQPGGKFFQDGIGVNMYGDVAEECNISHVPKLGDAFKDQQFKIGPKWEQYAAAIRRLKEGERDGHAIYAFRRGPGLPPSGAMIWTFDASDELRAESAVLAGGLINGVQIDEGGQLYFTFSASRLCAGKPFLAGHGGIVSIASK